MDRLKIVVWDNIGNVLLGMQPWDTWELRDRQQLLREDPDAERHVRGFWDLFREWEIDLVWLHDPAISTRGFSRLFEIYAPHLQVVQSPPDLTGVLDDADFLVLHKERLPPEALANARNLRLIQHLGQDYRGVPIAAAQALGVPVAAVPLVNYLAVAEHCWALILNHLKQLPAQREHMRNRGYHESWGRFPDLRLARDQTLGLLGFGEIARPIARVARAFEVRVCYWDIERFPELEREFGVEYVAWEELFRQSDIVSVQLALNEQTAGIIGARELGWMKAGALFLNTARGKLVDQPALVEALQQRRIAAALDVFAEEPLPVDDPLHTLHGQLDANVTLTPHTAWQSPWTWVRDSQEIWFNVLRVLGGEPPRHLVIPPA